MEDLVTIQDLANRLKAFARRYSISLICTGKLDIRAYHIRGTIEVSTFDWDIGIVRDQRRCVIFRARTPASGLIHELGHVLFDPPIGKMGEEFGWFGWEWEVAKACGIEEQWRIQNEGYGVDENRDFGDLSRMEQDLLLDERYLEARSLGYLNHLP